MDDAPTRLQLAAPAKLNLSLHVVGKRRDGFHELEGVMVLLELADELLLTPGDGALRVEPAGSGAPRDLASNLAWRGMVAGLGDPPRGLSLALTKRVPVAAGLGGGSSDAAAGWRLGRRHVGAPERAMDADLIELARIGADVPFFAAQVAVARVSGIGERVAPAELPPATGSEIVLALAPFPLPTTAVFAELREADWGRAGSSGNDLLAPARRLRPELDELIRLAVAAGVEPRLTGSGPTLFAALDDPERADAVAGRLQRGGVSVLRTRLRAEPASIEGVPTSTKEQG
ncbi:MAG: 4-(cytidine 5'-diphospho)-2-C-methyl-D-erythritol kinase [Chloroflexi bacterium]|nr:MAG: 4-(cytidine 5'-diphospho)-2-C-methyl-D-erythritol kinase [Chloroflexota bacterium]